MSLDESSAKPIVTATTTRARIFGFAPGWAVAPETIDHLMGYDPPRSTQCLRPNHLCEKNRRRAFSRPVPDPTPELGEADDMMLAAADP